MKKNINNWEVFYFALLIGAMACLLTGCEHFQVSGFGFTPSGYSISFTTKGGTK